jgi:hypothetical protein
MLFNSDVFNHFSESVYYPGALLTAHKAAKLGPPAQDFCRVWWVNEDNNPIILNGRTSSGYFPGLFWGGLNEGESGDHIRSQHIYETILNFIGVSHDSQGNEY